MYRGIITMAGVMAVALTFSLATAQQKRERPERPDRPEKEKKEVPKPDFADVVYGPYERNVLDFWKAKSDTPTPVVIFIHGGGFKNGDKNKVSPTLIGECRSAGISVVSISYRLSHIAPFPAPMHDGVRSVQFVRSKAAEWNIDPKRVACTGGSAGAGISLWIGFHEDMAKPDSPDPVERQSSRLTCMVIHGGQCTYDPREVKRIVGGRAHEHPALPPFFGVKSITDTSPEAIRAYEQSAAINYLTKDDPPVLATYGNDEPDDQRPGRGIHNVRLGIHLKEKMDKLGIECILIGPGIKQEEKITPLDFFKKHFGMTAKAKKEE